MPPAAFVAPTPLSLAPQLHKPVLVRNAPLRVQVRKRYRVPSCIADTSSTTQPETTSTSRLDTLLTPRTQRFVFFGGKGGVGKTSCAAAVAVRCADEGLRTLIISTDPAHSLGDALRMELSHGKVEKVDTNTELYAVESDPKEAVDQFRELVSSLKEEDEEGWSGVAAKLGLQEFGQVLETIPPGADELIALVAVLDLVGVDQFDRVIIDTAPTGHTLRFLTFPDFLERLLTRALALREKLDGARGVLGGVTKWFVGKKVDVDGGLKVAAEKVARYRDRMVELSDMFRDPGRSEFVVVSIATGLAVEESKRLIERLWEEGIWTRHCVVNMMLRDEGGVERYLERVRRGQMREISFATERIADEFGLKVTLVPRFDMEVRGVYGLEAVGDVAFREKRWDGYGGLFREDDKKESRFVFVGGKGGVGKTSIAGGLGVKLAKLGFKTLVLSTDPAHSLGDALQIDLGGTGGVVEVDGVGGGGLYGMEIDTEGAIKEFQQLAREYVKEGSGGVGRDVARKLGLEEFAGLLDNAPPGIDELVALTQVMELVKFGDFDRVVVDTAPTGHTLRLLGFPEFVDEFLDKVIKLKMRLDAAMQSLRGVLGGREEGGVDKAAQGVKRLRENMQELKELVSDRERTQFVVVTVPTGLAMAESERLVKSLKQDGVEVGNLIVNQVVPDAEARQFVRRIVQGQQEWVEELRRAAQGRVELTEVPYFDAEVRGVYALRAMGMDLFSHSASQHS